jgi:Wadjet anti plasmid transformation system JetA-like protein
MPRRFTDARELMGDLLDRYEGGASANPLAYPDYSGFADISAIDLFVKQLSEAEAAGAIRIAKGRGRNADRIEHVRLESPARLYALLDRRPVGELAAEASGRLLDGLDLPSEFQASLDAIRAAWDRGRSWQGVAAQNADRLRLALMFAKAILEGRHRGVDYRTFSRKIAGGSKALDQIEGAVVKLLSTAIDLPPSARPKDALRTLGLEKFAQPLLLSGRIDFAAAELSRAPSAYFGIPPAEAHRLRVTETPQYLLTIENFASFNRHVIEADPERMGLTLYVGGYPSLATQDALKYLAEIIPAEVPFFHWSDIDPDGTWIFRTIERIVARPLTPHLMSADLAERFGRVPEQAVRPPRGTENSAIAPLVAYLQSDGAKWLEQEELDPVRPGSSDRTRSPPG